MQKKISSSSHRSKSRTSALNILLYRGFNHFIFVLILCAGVVTTYAGGGSTGVAVDGTSSAAQFFGPIGIALSRNGDLFVTDTLTYKIRKINTAG